MGLPMRRVRTAGEESAARPDWTEPKHLADGAPQGFTAASTVVDIGQAASAKLKRIAQADWQDQAWHHYNRNGELQYAASWMANSLSRIRIYAAEVGDDGRPGDPTDNETAQAIAANLFGGPGEAAQQMAALGVHLTVPGDCYIVSETTEGSDSDDWYVISTTELEKKGSQLGVNRGDGWRVLDEDKSVLIRVWNPHPQRREEATSATRAVLPVLRELEKQDLHMEATLDSKLAGAGVLFVPDNITFQVAKADGITSGSGASQFMAMLTEAMMTSVDDRNSPAALAPIIAAIPEDAIEKVHYQTFVSELTGAIREDREANIRRLALGLDMPPEELLGKSEAAHWGSWQIEEAGIKVHIEPKALTICSALTDSYFRPALKAAGIENTEDYVLWYDISELVLRPNRADSAKVLGDDGRISDEVVVREAGFDPEADMPTVEEKVASLLRAAALGGDAVADVLPALIHLWGGGKVDSMPPVGNSQDQQPAEEQPAEDDAPAEETPDEGQDEDGDVPTTGPDGGEDSTGGPAADAGLALAREIAVENLVSRGLEYAGKKLLTRDRRGTFDADIRTLYLEPGITVEAEKVPRLLEGAFTYLPEVADQVGLDGVALQRQIIDHVGGLLTSGAVHERRYSRTIARLCS